jgi:hypothetical protein
MVSMAPVIVVTTKLMCKGPVELPPPKTGQIDYDERNSRSISRLSLGDIMTKSLLTEE